MMKKFFSWVCIIGIFTGIFNVGQVYGATEDVIEASGNGIVEIQSGFINPKGKFCQMQSGSGFLISNEEGATYIVTNQSIAENSKKEIKKYCKENDINTEKTQMTNTVRIVVKGDVTVEAEILVKSEEENYCVLSTENVVSERNALKLGDSSKIEYGDEVYALGFPENAEGIGYLASDVEVTDGKIEDASQMKHSISIHKGNAGGPLLDEAGYVIGMNFESSTTSLPINELAEILDNFAIYYGNNDVDVSYNKLQQLYEECLNLEASGDYKKATVEELTTTLEAAKEVLDREKPEFEEVDEVYRQLTAAKVKLIPKTPKTVIAVFVLAGFIGVLVIWLVILLILNLRDKKKGKKIERAGSITNSATGSVPASKEKKRKTKKKIELFRVENGQVIAIKKDTFYIGSKPDMVDFCIADNKSISRRHGVIFLDGTSYYYSDMKSLNGSKVNGVPVTEGQKVELHTGDEIMMANEVFVVR